MGIAVHELEAVVHDPKNEFPRAGVKKSFRNLKYVFLTRVPEGDSMGQALHDVKTILAEHGGSIDILCAWPSSFVIR